MAEAQRLISNKEVSEDSLKYKLDKMKGEKNDEIERLKKGLAALKDQLSQANLKNDGELVKQRTDFINETENRIVHVRKLTLDIENTLL